MQVLSKQNFKDSKTSNVLVIYGSGSSINDITEDDWKKLDKFDSLSFNWFCKHKTAKVKYFLIREQANIPKRVTKSETIKELFRCINEPHYTSTCFIVHDLRAHSPHAHCYIDDIDQIPGTGIIVADTQKGNLEQDIFDTGVFHGNTTLMNALHIAKYLQYEKIIFAGIDLYNCEYFWISGPKPRSNIQQKGLSKDDVHPTSKAALDAIKQFKERSPHVVLSCLNPKSMLTKVMQHESI